MKQVNLTITFDEEKLSALKRYMGKKELDLDREMTDALVKLYEKYVPAPVREYIDESDVSAAAPVSYTHLDVYKRQGHRSAKAHPQANASGV